MQLWTERGFENGVETTTVEEIARAAGVTKGTFYFHFAHKEDVLLEMSLTTSAAMAEDAEAPADLRCTIDESCCRRSRRWPAARNGLPRAAIGRTIREFYKYPDRVRDLSMTRDQFPGFFRKAQGAAASSPRGSIPSTWPTCSTRR